MSRFFNATTQGKTIGDGTVAALVRWIEKFVNVLFPDNGIEYWSDNGVGANGLCLKPGDQVPGAGCRDENVHHVACYVRPGNCEGRVIGVVVALRSGHFKSLCWAKSFGSADECWKIAQAIDDALNSIIFWEQIPEIVSMFDKLPRQYRSARETTLAELVTIRVGSCTLRVATDSGLVFDERSFTDAATAGSSVQAVALDWSLVLQNAKAMFVAVAQEHDRIDVPDLPGYLISKRGCDVPGFYVLPPGGKENDDRTYLGYFPDSRAAIQASRDHKASAASGA